MWSRVLNFIFGPEDIDDPDVYVDNYKRSREDELRGEVKRVLMHRAMLELVEEQEAEGNYNYKPSTRAIYERYWDTLEAMKG